jgi:hypothetical protein
VEINSLDHPATRISGTILHANWRPGVKHGMNKALLACLLTGVAALLFAQQPGRTTATAPGRIVTGGGSQAPLYAPFELLSVYPQESSNGEFEQVDPAQLQSLSDQGWQLVSVAPYVYRNEGHTATTPPDASSPPPPLVTQVYLAYFFQRARLIR